MRNDAGLGLFTRKPSNITVVIDLLPLLNYVGFGHKHTLSSEDVDFIRTQMSAVFDSNDINLVKHRIQVVYAIHNAQREPVSHRVTFQGDLNPTIDLETLIQFFHANFILNPYIQPARTPYHLYSHKIDLAKLSAIQDIPAHRIILASIYKDRLPTTLSDRTVYCSSAATKLWLSEARVHDMLMTPHADIDMDTRSIDSGISSTHPPQHDDLSHGSVDSDTSSSDSTAILPGAPHPKSVGFHSSLRPQAMDNGDTKFTPLASFKLFTRESPPSAISKVRETSVTPSPIRDIYRSQLAQDDSALNKETYRPQQGRSKECAF